MTPIITEEHPSEKGTTVYQPSDGGRKAQLTDEEKKVSSVVVGGSSLEALGGATAVVLSIIGLTGRLPLMLAAISCIAIGGALFFASTAVATRWRTLRRTAARTTEQEAFTASGFSIEAIAGLAGVVLGILALVGVDSRIVLPIAEIVLGGALLFGAPAQSRLNATMPARDEHRQHMMTEGMRTASGLMALAGAGAVVLGILSLVGVGPVITIALVSTLALGGGLLLGGAMVAGRFSIPLAHRTA